MKKKLLLSTVAATILITFPGIGLFAQVETTPEARQEKEEQAMQEHEIQVKLEREASRAAREASHAWVSTGSGNSFVYSVGGPEKSSRLSLSKEYDNESTEKSGEFKVEKSVKKMRLNIHGQVQSGQIKVSLILPGGESYQELTIDDSAELQWSSSFSIEEDETKYFGSWKYKVKATDAEGWYNLSITTY